MSEQGAPIGILVRRSFGGLKFSATGPTIIAIATPDDIEEIVRGILGGDRIRGLRYPTIDVHHGCERFGNGTQVFGVHLTASRQERKEWEQSPVALSSEDASDVAGRAAAFADKSFFSSDDQVSPSDGVRMVAVTMFRRKGPKVLCDELIRGLHGAFGGSRQPEHSAQKMPTNRPLVRNWGLTFDRLVWR